MDARDRFDPPIIQRIVSAEDTDLPEFLTITSVFDLSFAELKLRPDTFTQGTPHPWRRLIRGDGWTRCEQIEERDTPEFIEREYQRRARQILPRPPKTAMARWSRFAA